MRVVIAGTTTEIGKTFVGVHLVRAAVTSALRAVGLKPVESGLGGTFSDRQLLAEAGSFHVKHWPYGFPEPISPHLAAVRAGVEIDLRVIVDWVDRNAADAQFVELPGGLLSPLNQCQDNLDLVRELRPHHLLVVAPDRLGVLAEVTALASTVRARAPELPRARIVINAPKQRDDSTDTNARALAELGHLVIESVPRLPDGEAATFAVDILRKLSLPV